jgi:hypothetical protein
VAAGDDVGDEARHRCRGRHRATVEVTEDRARDADLPAVPLVPPQAHLLARPAVGQSDVGRRGVADLEARRRRRDAYRGRHLVDVPGERLVQHRRVVETEHRQQAGELVPVPGLAGDRPHRAGPLGDQVTVGASAGRHEVGVGMFLLRSRRQIDPP